MLRNDSTAPGDGAGGMTRLLIALDVDGTIVGPGGVISARVRTAIKAVRAAGHHVLLSTGRSPVATVPVGTDLGLAGGFAVCSNGATSIGFGAVDPARHTVIAGRAFDPQALLLVLAKKVPGLGVAAEGPGLRGFRATATFPREELPGAVRLVSLDELGVSGASRLLVDARGSLRRVAAIVDGLGLSFFADLTGAVPTAEVLPSGVSKASALEEVRVALGVEAAHTVAIGDNVNDIEMLRWAARGIAMGHASSMVKDAAAEVTESYGNDGLAIVLEPIGGGTRTSALSGDAEPLVMRAGRLTAPWDA
jgi:magnesium-transporting ATPase (P-type)